MNRLASLILLLSAICFFPASGFGFYCGSQLIQIGDQQDYVLSSCGEPQNREDVVRTIKRHGRKENIYGSREIWTFNFGSTEFVQMVTFQDGRVVSIKQGGYGGEAQ